MNLLEHVRMPQALRALALWTLLALALHLVWELAHLPLYTLWQDPDRRRVAAYVLHCLLGDVLLADASFLVVAAVLRNPHWPLAHPWIGGSATLAMGLGFTAWSEWNGVYVRGAWAYTAAMPLVAGVGLTPLLQWIVVPALTILLFRRLVRHPTAGSPADGVPGDE